MISVEVFKSLLANAAIIASGIYIMGRFLPLGRKVREYNAIKIIGVTLISISSILFPFKYQSGILIDLRQVPIATLGLVSGLKPAVLAAIIPGIFRLSLGGAGAWSGVWFMCVLPAAAGGLLHVYDIRANNGRQFVMGRGKYKYLAVLSMVSWVLVLIPLYFILPGGRAVIKDVFIAYFIVLLGAYYLIGSLVIDCVNTEEYKLRLEYEASTDYTTTLMNYRYFMKKANDGFRRSSHSGNSCSVILIDIDDFKAFNDTNGHLRGDRLLAELSEMLIENTREWDIVARYGGEEFIIFMENTDFTVATKVAERNRLKVQSSRFLENDRGGGSSITISSGVAGYPEHGLTLLDIIEKADVALYRAKNQGKNRVIAFDGQKAAVALQRMKSK